MGLNWGWKEVAGHRNTVEAAIKETERQRGGRRPRRVGVKNAFDFAECYIGQPNPNPNKKIEWEIFSLFLAE